MGFLFASYLLNMGVRNLVLTGRSPILARRSRIQALEALGGNISYLQCDVSNADQMRKGLIDANKKLGAINGVIHAAGIEGKRSIFEKRIRGIRTRALSKGSRHPDLDDILANEPLDFICYFSSIAAILGDFGSCDYAIGNRFEMAYGKYRNELKRKGNVLVKQL